MNFGTTDVLKKRPAAVTIVSIMFVAAGVVGIAYHASELKLQWPLEPDIVLALSVRILAIVGGMFLFLGMNWARWLLILWLVYHVGLSAFHSVGQVLFHAFFLAVVVFFLFRPNVSAYFHRTP